MTETKNSDQINGQSLDVARQKLDQLKQLMPEIFTEDQIDLEKFKLTLGEAFDLENERYVLNWAGKSDAFRVLQQPTTATLGPAPEESINFETSQNVFIEGENLEVLKAIQKAYFGQVKLIYIDPPYNTGNDHFIYPDKFAESKEEYLQRIEDKDEAGYMLREGLFHQNSSENGHFHSNWLSMMYPRLFLARNLLREDGVIFISIDDNEAHNLRLLMNEVFGEENFITQITWKKTYGGGSKVKHVIGLHEYILSYARNKEAIGPIELPPNPETRKYYTGKDKKFEIRGPFRTQPLATTSMDERPNLRFPIRWQGEEIWPEKQWQWSQERVLEALANNELIISNQSGKWSVRYKQYLYDEEGKERGAKPFSILDGPYTQEGTTEIKNLLGDGKIFPFPKPTSLLKHLCSYVWKDKNAIILDFFAGSATVAQAVLELNQADSGYRRFICIQLPEKIDKDTEAYKAGYLTVADIGKERIRRAIQKIEAENPMFVGQGMDLGFKVFKLKPSNFKIWRGDMIEDETDFTRQLPLFASPARTEAEDDNILYELILKSGYPLTAEIERKGTYYSVAKGELIIVLAAIDEGLAQEIIARRPKVCLCLDKLFKGNDPLKTNTVFQMRDAGIKFTTI